MDAFFCFSFALFFSSPFILLSQVTCNGYGRHGTSQKFLFLMYAPFFPLITNRIAIIFIWKYMFEKLAPVIFDIGIQMGWSAY